MFEHQDQLPTQEAEEIENAATDQILETEGAEVSEVGTDELIYNESTTEAVRNEGPVTSANTNIIWGPVHESFRPRKSISLPRTCRTSDIFSSSSKPFDIFLKFFPKSLVNYIAQNTNFRIDKARLQVRDRGARARKQSYMTATDSGEIIVVLGCTLIMGYNQQPSFSEYWSTKPSLGNPATNETI